MDNNNKELGLIDILKIMGQWMVSLVKTLTHWLMLLIFFAIKRWKIFAVVGLVAGIFALISHARQDEQREASMIVRANAVEAAQMKKHINAYAATLGNNWPVNAADRAQVNEMATFLCVDKNKDGIVDKVADGGRYASEDIDSLHLCIRVRFENAKVLPVITDGLVRYLAGTPFIANSNANRLLELKQKEQFLMDEIALLNTFQERTYAGADVAEAMESNGSYIFVGNKEALVYEDKLILLEMLETVQRDLNMNAAPITVVEDFLISGKAVNSLGMLIKKYEILCFSATYLLLFLIFIFRREKDKYLK